MKYVLVLCLITLATFTTAKPNCAGGTSDVVADVYPDVREDINNSLLAFSASAGISYTLETINTASTQVVAGVKYVINAEIMKNNGTITCEIEIWYKPAPAGGIEFTLQCPGEQKWVRND